MLITLVFSGVIPAFVYAVLQMVAEAPQRKAEYEARKALEKPAPPPTPAPKPATDTEQALGVLVLGALFLGALWAIFR